MAPVKTAEKDNVQIIAKDGSLGQTWHYFSEARRILRLAANGEDTDSFSAIRDL